MKNIIVNREELPKKVRELLPKRIADGIVDFSKDKLGLGAADIEDIYVSRGRGIWVSASFSNYYVEVYPTREEIDELLLNACDGSAYAYAETVRKGYIPVGDGVRLGVGGDWTEGGIIRIDSVFIRIPHRDKSIGLDFRGLLGELGAWQGILIFSRPLGGKTTALRQAIRELSGGESPLRVVAVDTREELEYGSSREWCVNFLSRYPKKEGIEIAVRSMGAEAVVCDEIGPDEVGAICELHGGGIPLLASAHGGSIEDLLSRKGMDELHRRGVFGAYVELCRGVGEGYVVHKRRDIP